MNEPTFDPLETPLPCDITAGHVTFRKGVHFRSVALRMQALYDLAVGNIGTKEEVDEILGVCETPARKAALHLVNRMQTDPRLAYLIGPGSESFELLVAAAAQADGIEHDDLRERVLGRISLQPVPGIGKVGAVLDPEVLARIAVYDKHVHDLDNQDDLNMLANHFIRRGLDVAEAERDTITKELF